MEVALFHAVRQTDGRKERQKSGHDEALLDSALRKRLKIYGRCIIGTTILRVFETNVLDCQK